MNIAALFFSCLIVCSPSVQSAELMANSETGYRLDWNAPRRWVHIDNVRGDGVQAFEQARKNWLEAIGSGARFLPDGRPLFWVVKRDAVNTYLTFYPFARLTDLEQRLKDSASTNAQVGSAALDRYDAASDATLVPPHSTEIWNRSPSLDHVPSGSRLSEVDAGAALFESYQQTTFNDDQLETVWKRINSALESQKFPLTCKGFFSAYGTGRLHRLCFAETIEQLRSAPTLEASLINELGAAEAHKVLSTLTRYSPLVDRSVIERRPDLSHLP